MYLKLFAAMMMASCAAGALELEPHGCGNKKIILTGWEFSYLTPADYLANADELDKTPADGVVIYIQKNPAVGRNYSAIEIMDGHVWKDEHFSDLVEPFKKMAEHRSMKHSFIKSFRAPKRSRLDWRDTNAWAVVANNVAVVARLAKKVGFPGIQMDVEDYSGLRQFWRVENDPPLPELKLHVRHRAREVGKAIFDAYPDVTIFSYFGLSAMFFRLEERSVKSVALAKRDLLPAFLDGLLDVMPPTARFQEGNENAYRYDHAKRDFLTAKTRNCNWYLPLVSPENRVKYLTQVITGLGLYMDSYSITNSASPWYFPPIEGSRLEYLRRNVSQALSGTDEYVWLWGEKGRWIDWKITKHGRLHGGAKQGRWDELIPGGLFESLKLLKDPTKYLLPKIDEAIAQGMITNIISNPTCAFAAKGEPGLKPGRVPKPFGTWSPKPKKGQEKTQIGVDTSCGDGDSVCLFIKGAPGGCVTFEKDSITPPGSWYYVKARVKGEGAWPSLNFRTKDRKWLGYNNYLPIEGDNLQEWQTLRGILQVPEGADGFTLTLGCRFTGPNEIVRYDNVELYSLPAELVTGNSFLKGK